MERKKKAPIDWLPVGQVSMSACALGNHSRLRLF